MNLISFKQKINEILKTKSNFNFLNKILSKIFYFNLKYSNYFQNIYEFVKKKDYLFSYPSIVSLNTTNLCNYRCLFCEIHYFYEFAKNKAGKIFPNNINVDFIRKFEDLFNRVVSIELSGASGEPLVNPNFINICKQFRKKKIELSVTTNGSLLKKVIAESLVYMNFNHVVVSLHSGDEGVYHELQGGNFNKILKNLKDLILIRKTKGSKFPVVTINCLIFKLNQHTILNLINEMKEIGIDEININQYYASRNKINAKVSFHFYPNEGNKFLREIYQYADSIDFRLTPEKPNFINLGKRKKNINTNFICQSPWKSLKLKGCIEFENSHYVCVCNRIILFRLNYEEFDGDFLEDIWNHEIIRYFRKTVMKNPVCRFCRNPETSTLRCLNNRKYQIERDNAVQDFLTDAFEKIKIIPRKGIYLLDENPYKYLDYYERS